MGKIILPMHRFKTNVLMKAPLGKNVKTIGGILISIQKKFWIGVLIYTIISWCLAAYFMRSIYT